MSHKINRLSQREIATKRKMGRYADGGGLYLQVSRQLTKSWLFRFTLHGKARQMGLGSLNTISLAEARQEAENCRKLLWQAIDPIEAKKEERARRQLEAVRAMTFKDCAESYIKSHSDGWGSAEHARQWTRSLEVYVYPIFGSLSVQAVDTAFVLKAIEPIWAIKTETATRVRARIEAILDWATAREYRDGENPARWRGHLIRLLPAPSRFEPSAITPPYHMTILAPSWPFFGDKMDMPQKDLSCLY